MAFTKALYYPTIGIPNEGWLKNAMLYWTEIYTIFPRVYRSERSQFYQTRTEQEFSDAGLLLPLEVYPKMPEIEELKDDVLKFLDTPEGEDVLSVRKSIKSVPSPEDRPQRHILIEDIVEIHRDKFPEKILHQLRHNSSDDWVSVNRGFADFYMTLLAAHLAASKEAGLLTYALAFDRLANAVRVNAPVYSTNNQKMSSIAEKLRHENRHRLAQPPTLAQGMLANLVIEGIKIDPDTPVKKILDFRRTHEDDIGHFRVKIAELTAGITEDLPPEQLRQKVDDIYINEVRPAINGLKRGLKDSLISWGTGNVLYIAGLSTISPVLLTALFHIPAPYNLIVGAGITVSLSAIQFNRNRAGQLRQNPYSFVLEAQRTLHRKSTQQQQP